MNVCIVGGGNIGTSLACYIKHNDPQKNVSLFTGHPEKFSKTLKCNDIEQKISYDVELDCISGDASVAVKDSDIVFIALPHFAVEKAFADIAPHVNPDTYVGVLPGGGGCEFFFDKYFNDDITLFGFQRVPFTARLVKYGEETNLVSWKKFNVVGTLKKDRVESACKIIEKCGLKTKQTNNYLEVALTPTNPVLHTPRIYEVFSGHDRNYVFPDKIKFYVDWTDKASKIMLDMDKELHTLLNKITEIDTSAIRPLTEHYESPTYEALTKKLNTIPAFKTRLIPMVPAADGNGFVADTNSRMFTEDFSWGLAIIREYCSFFGVSTPTIDMLLKWYADFMGLEWFVNGEFCGKDLDETGIPQRYGINTKEQLLSCYLH